MRSPHVGAVLVLAALALAGCQEPGDLPKEENDGSGKIFLTVDKTALAADGIDMATLDVAGAITTHNGEEVVFTTTHGELANGLATFNVVIADGKVSTTMTCATAGIATVKARLGEVESEAKTINCGGATANGAIALTATPAALVALSGATSDITATVTGPAGAPAPDGTAVSFTTSLGALDGAATSSATTTGGVAHTTLAETGTTGSAAITASANVGGQPVTGSLAVRIVAEGEVTVDVSADTLELHQAGEASALTITVTRSGEPAQDGTVHLVSNGSPSDVGYLRAALADTGEDVELDVPVSAGTATAFFVSSGLGIGQSSITAAFEGIESAPLVVTVAPAPDLATIQVVSVSEPVVGVKGSLKEKTSTIVFELQNDAGEALGSGKDVLIRLSDSASPLAQVLPGSARTDAQGRIQVVYSPGGKPEPAQIIASATNALDVRVTGAATVQVVNGVPNQRSLSFGCEGGTRVMSADCLGDTTACPLFMADRESGFADEGWEVHFVSEFGSVSTPVPADGNGVSTTTPRIQAPMPVGNRNTDYLSTVLAYTNGEEDFTDLNENGIYDAGEPFGDMGEPFVDANDNQRWDDGERFIDRQDGTLGQYDGANGLWDNDTLIWKDTTVVWSQGVDASSIALQESPTSVNCSSIRFEPTDANGNCLSPDGTGSVSLSEITGANVVFGANPVALGNCFDMSFDAQVYDVGVAIISRATDANGNPVDPIIRADFSWTQSCHAPSSSSAFYTCQ